jgi:choline-sulfatase
MICAARGLLLASAIAMSAAPVGCKSRPDPSAAQRDAASDGRADTANAVAVPNVDNVILITVDAFRADQPWSGRTEGSTPNLSRFASKSVVYTRAYSLANITTPSLCGMLSGRYPSELTRDTCVIGRCDLDGSLVPTLQAAGVRTLAAHGHAIFAGAIAPSIGFDEWKLVRGAAGRLQVEGAVTGSDQADLLIGLLDQKWPPGSKHFAWAHFVDPHDSYVKHKDFPPSAKGDRGLYDGEVAYTDAVIGRVLDHLQQSGLDERTAVIVTGDHGEAFGEHGVRRHGFSFFQEEIRVPLMVRIPGVVPREIKTPRSALDLAPTVLDLLGIRPPDRFEGVSLLRDLTGRSPAERAVIVDVPENTMRPGRRVVILGATKVIFEPGNVSVFDLNADPGERSPIEGAAADAAKSRAESEMAVVKSVDATPCAQAGGAEE